MEPAVYATDDTSCCETDIYYGGYGQKYVAIAYVHKNIAVKTTLKPLITNVPTRDDCASASHILFIGKRLSVPAHVKRYVSIEKYLSITQDIEIMSPVFIDAAQCIKWFYRHGERTAKQTNTWEDYIVVTVPVFWISE